jgi:hypothetical protein
MVCRSDNYTHARDLPSEYHMRLWLRAAMTSDHDADATTTAASYTVIQVTFLAQCLFGQLCGSDTFDYRFG